MIDHQSHQDHVHVSTSMSGGRDVTALLDGHVMWTCHCDDWHRTERARRRMELALRARRHVVATPEISTR
jgi:hypothetical protein